MPSSLKVSEVAVQVFSTLQSMQAIQSFANKIKISLMTSWLQKPQKLHPSKSFMYMMLYLLAIGCS